MTPQPPKRALQFLRWFCREDYLEEFEGDLIEIFEENHMTSPRRANWQFRFGVLRHFRPMFIRSFHIYNKAMIRHNFKISIRTLIRDKAYTVLNIGSLAIGIAVAIMIGLWIWDEFSYDRHHAHYDQIAQLMQNQTFNGVVETSNNQPQQIAPVLRDYYGSNFKHVTLSTIDFSLLMSVGEKKINVVGRYMEPNAAHLFSLPMKAGTRDGLTDPNSILIAESTARSLFGRTDVINETIQIGGAVDMKVTGVYEDLPFNSSFREMKYLAPWDFYVDRFNIRERAGWGNNWFQVYVQLNDNITMEEASAQIREAKITYANNGEPDRFKPEHFLFPMQKWRLYDEFENGKISGGAIQYIW
ncbi:MAG: ABC transporter permease, partial [Bacteroidota bacterium]